MSEIPAKRRPGQPTKYNSQKAQALLTAMAEGVPWTDAIKAQGLGIETVYGWERMFPEFSEALDRAREARAHRFADEVLEIADNTSRDYVEYVTKSGDVRLAPNHAAATRDRLRCDMRWRLMGKWAPQAYGDTQRVELTGANGGPILLEQITLLAVQRLESERVSAQHGPQVIDNTADQPSEPQLTHTSAHTKHER